MFLLSLVAFAWLAAFLLSFSTSTLGCFVLWRRMSYFGDTLAHGSMLGFSLAIALQINFYLGLIFTVFLITLLLFLIEHRSKVLHMDSILGIVAHTSLSLGFIIISILAQYVRVDVLDYLFGDLLIVDTYDLCIIAVLSVTIIALIAYHWRNLLTVLISEEMAIVEGINVRFYKTLLVILLAFVVATSITLIGALLITSLLIIPASTARRFATSPKQMIIYSFVISNIAIAIGITTSVYFSFPTSPAIVACLGIMFLLSLLCKRIDS
ncbi:iron chelate uptake ABC transporter family permease subunit [Psittacicella hinzii]|uniref:High-affinity zinc uptake system membrane protein ZnuB n=1 Tax=Psittacicella hinzii TaxID=2028575 RepID=A0A3A1YTS8_9GAMM|nr:iron chelate uptake ABC transporter family permease subunit [Psittacicella hinzii]RIY39457.1 hypothetical protein CKF58_02200 [Psittacicella hinzii]